MLNLQALKCRFHLVKSTLAFGVVTILATTTANAANLTEYTVRHVQKAYALQQEERLSDAVATLLSIESNKPYDNAYVNRMLGSLYWQLSKPKSATKHLVLSVDSGALSEQEQRESVRMLADLRMMEPSFPKAEKRYKQLLALMSENSSTTSKSYEMVWLRIAQAQYQQEKWSSVEASVDKQQHYQRKAKLRAKAEPLKMKLGAQLAKEKWKSAISTTRSLRSIEPNEALWWRQLTALYMQTEQHSQALITLQQADRAGFDMSQEQLTLMAQLYGRLNAPYKAAETYGRLAKLDSSAKLLSQQASYWQLSKEWDKALVSWKKAANLDSKFNRQYALLHMQQQNYASALQAINRLKKPDTTTLLTKVRALNELGQPEEALRIATAIHKHSPSDSTLSWIKFLSEGQ
ncbi:tetratricopeptide repeat protein [Vibrio sp. WJH972]